MTTRFALVAALVSAMALACSGAARETARPRVAVVHAVNADARPDARAAKMRARVPALRAAGRIDRAARVLARAAEIDPAGAPATWADELDLATELGRVSAGLALAARVDGAREA